MTGTFRRGHFIVEIYEGTLYIRHAIVGSAWLLFSAAFGRLNALIAARPRRLYGGTSGEYSRFFLLTVARTTAENNRAYLRIDLRAVI